MAANNNDDNNKEEKKTTRMRRSIFTEVDEREKKLAATRKKAATDWENSLTADNTTDELVYTLLTKAMREMFERTDRLQGGSFIHGSMGRLSADMWKGVTRKK